MASRLGASLWVLWMCSRMQAREMAANPFNLIIGVVQPAVLLIITTGLGRVDDPARMTSLITGVVLTALWASTVFVAGGILHRELQLGTLAANVASTHAGYLTLLGKCLGATSRTIATILIASALTTAAIGAPIRFSDPGLLLLGFLTVVLSGTALGMLLSCVFLVSRYGAHLSSALIYPIFLVGGMLIPPAALPAALQPLSAVVSLRWAQDFLVGAAIGQVRIGSYLLLLGLTAAYFGLGIVAFRLVVNRARRRGTLELI